MSCNKEKKLPKSEKIVFDENKWDNNSLEKNDDKSTIYKKIFLRKFYIQRTSCKVEIIL